MEYNLDLKEVMFKEIDLIQDIMKRMASNSFLIKGWTITLVTVTLLFKGNPCHSWLAFLPLLTFWILDAYFLWQEKMYRELYQWVANNRIKSSEYLFDLNAYRFKVQVPSMGRVAISDTLRWFYGSILLLTLFYLALS